MRFENNSDRELNLDLVKEEDFKKRKKKSAKWYEAVYERACAITEFNEKDTEAEDSANDKEKADDVDQEEENWWDNDDWGNDW